jgi:hypothetical protein
VGQGSTSEVAKQYNRGAMQYSREEQGSTAEMAKQNRRGVMLYRHSKDSQSVQQTCQSSTVGRAKQYRRSAKQYSRHGKVV